MENRYGLIASPKFWAMSEAEIDFRYEGWGPGKIGNRWVPDTFYGLDVRIAWQVHDYDYEVGRTSQEKQEADCRLLHNLYIIIQSEPANWLTALRYERAVNYYEMVMIAGRKSFNMEVV